MENTNQNTVVKYLIITFLITYISWFGLSLLTNFNIISSYNILFNILHILGGFGPTIGAIMVLSDKSFENIKKFIFSYKKNTTWILLFYCFIQLLIIGLSSSKTNPEIPLFMLIVVFLLSTFIGGGNEELGWRGIMQPELEKKFSYPIATFITGTAWMLWHIPLWFIDGMGQQNVNYFAYFMFGIILSFWLATIYKKTNSVFYCMIFHGFSNTVLSYFMLEINFIFIIGLLGLLIFSIWFANKKE